MIKAKKSLGQHFLKSEPALMAILTASDPHTDDIILEIGPGEGVLTKILLPNAKKIVAVEKDNRLIPILKEKFGKEIENGKLDLMEKDILDFDPEILKSYDHPYKVIANIPYYITGEILRKFLDCNYQPQQMTLLIQKEVAERIVARDGKESLLSLSVKIFGDPVIIRSVPRGSFAPPPSVDSAIINIENISKSKLKDMDEKLFFEVIHLGFSHKRKQLLPNLSKKFEKENLINIFKELNLDLKTRAEDLPLETWTRLVRAVSSVI